MVNMGNKSSATDTAALRLEILRRIPEKHPRTVQELQFELEGAGIFRGERTIQRHLEELAKDKSLGIIQDKRNKPYGYRRKVPISNLQITNISPQEALLLNLAKENLNNILPAQLKQAMRGFFDEASRNLHHGQDTQLALEWTKKVRVVSSTYPLLPPKIQEGVLDTVSEALYNNLYLYLEYISADGKPTNTQVMPLGLAQQDSRLYLVVRYDGYDNERTLALHRIHYCKLTNNKFQHPIDFDLQKYALDGRFNYGEGQYIILSFCIHRVCGQHLYETALSEDQKIELLSPEVLRVTATVVDSMLLDRWLCGFGRDIWDVRWESVE